MSAKEATARININKLLEVDPLSPLATQQAIVAEIQAEQVLIAVNRELIARVWGEATPEPAQMQDETI